MQSKDQKASIPSLDTECSILCLKLKIAATRDLLQLLWEEHGVTNETVLAVGERLDVLLNQYQELTINNRPKLVRKS